MDRKSIFALALTIAGNLFLAWVFWSARGPQHIGARIVQSNFWVLAAEFLAIYASGITSGKQVEAERNFAGAKLPPGSQKRRILPALFLLIVAALLARYIQKPWLAVFFVASFLAKYFGHRAVRTHPLTVITLVWFLASLSMFVITQSLTETMLRLWGIGYFAVSAVIVAMLFSRERAATHQ